MEDDIIATYSQAIPGVCRAMWIQDPAGANGEPPLYDPQALLRHFLAINLQHLVTPSNLTKAIVKRIENTAAAIGIDGKESSTGSSEDYPFTERTRGQWARWRNRIQRSALESNERICFRLTEADRQSPEVWRLEWLLSSRSDPFLLIPLADF